MTQLRSSLLRYPADTSLAALVDDLRTRSRRFDALWRAPRPVAAYESSATFTQSDGDSVTLVGNLIAIPGDDLAAVMLTAAPGSADEARLAELVGASEGRAVVEVGRQEEQPVSRHEGRLEGRPVSREVGRADLG